MTANQDEMTSGTPRLTKSETAKMRTADSPHGRALKWTTLAWLGIVFIATLTLGLLALTSPRLLRTPALDRSDLAEASIIAVASLLIAYASLLPGLLGGRFRRIGSDRLGTEGRAPESRAPESRAPESREMRIREPRVDCNGNELARLQTGQLVAGVMIRVVGTVALFLTCRYQMSTATEAVAAMTIGWYVVLTLVDVMVLARELAKPSGLMDPAALPPKQRHSFG